LVVWTDDDPHFPIEQGHAVTAGIPRAELQTMAGASHWFMWERADDFVDLLRDFLT